MIVLSLHELTALTVGLAVIVVAAVFVDVACAWRQEKELRQLRAAMELQQEQQERIDGDVDQLWAWAWSWTDQLAAGDQTEPALEPWTSATSDDEPDTVISHPADSFARKQHLLARPAPAGQHRAPSTSDSASPAPAPPRTES